MSDDARLDCADMNAAADSYTAKIKTLTQERDEARDELYAMKECLRIDHGYEFEGNIVNATAEFLWRLKQERDRLAAKSNERG